MRFGDTVAVGQPAAAGADGPDLDVVVVSYRCRELVLRTIGSLEPATQGLRVSVTVVDNDSRDGTVEALRNVAFVTVVPVGWNSGFASATNLGMARGTGRYVLLLNPDTVLAENALRILVAFADDHPRAGVVAPRLLNVDGTDQRTARAFPTPAAAVLGRRSPLIRWFPGNPWSARYLAPRRVEGSPGSPAAGPPDPGGAFRVDWVSGAAMLVRRDVVAEVGPLDPGFFLFWEDADWCRRITDAGYEVWCVPTAEVVHAEGGTRQHGWSAPTIRWFHEGAYRYWVKHHAPSPWDPTRWAAAVLLTVRAALLTVVHGVARTGRTRSRPTADRTTDRGVTP